MKAKSPSLLQSPSQNWPSRRYSVNGLAVMVIRLSFLEQPPAIFGQNLVDLVQVRWICKKQIFESSFPFSQPVAQHRQKVSPCCSCRFCCSPAIAQFYSSPCRLPGQISMADPLWMVLPATAPAPSTPSPQLKFQGSKRGAKRACG